MWRVSGRWSPKCGSLPRDAGDLVGLKVVVRKHKRLMWKSCVRRAIEFGCDACASLAPFARANVHVVAVSLYLLPDRSRLGRDTRRRDAISGVISATYEK